MAGTGVRPASVWGPQFGGRMRGRRTFNTECSLPETTLDRLNVECSRLNVECCQLRAAVMAQDSAASCRAAPAGDENDGQRQHSQRHRSRLRHHRVVDEKVRREVSVLGTEAARGEVRAFSLGKQHPAEIGLGVIQPELRVLHHFRGGREGVGRLADAEDELLLAHGGGEVDAGRAARRGPGDIGEKAMCPGGFRVVRRGRRAHASVVVDGEFVTFAPGTEHAIEAIGGRVETVARLAGDFEDEGHGIDDRLGGNQAGDVKFEEAAVPGEVLGGAGVDPGFGAVVPVGGDLDERGVGGRINGNGVSWSGARGEERGPEQGLGTKSVAGMMSHGLMESKSGAGYYNRPASPWIWVMWLASFSRGGVTVPPLSRCSWPSLA